MNKIEINLHDLVSIILQSLEQKNYQPRKFGLSIVIADSGHIWVGQVERDRDFIYITGGATIRRWGTENGIGQLAESGPTTETKLDRVPHVIVPNHAVIAIIPCIDSVWTGKI